MILTVCTGNICRSPIAAFALASHLPDADFDSAGLGALVGNDVDPKTRKAAEMQGLEVPVHSAQQCTQELVLGAKAILVMENHHRRDIMRRWPFASGKTFLLGHFEDQKKIPDPYRMGVAAHMHSVSLILESAKIWAQKLKDV
ncbi:low molecular weight protein-tyrosine-phosphatase [Donghicola eburneus]|uniref:low molecular weight protein-tyrosine-phosphatase n=1 Tax=Donghicola eburneus TaxID=393278 RepID=UPI000B837536|nr:low molecular weight protein-tyrosine-phosphatase [Donghicola eburneus]